MQAGTRDATRTIVVLSPAYLESVYAGAEWQAAWASDPVGADQKLLIARVAPADSLGLLSGVVGVDLFSLTEDEAKARLRSMVSAAIAGRAKPSAAPGFPGAGRAMPRPARFPGARRQVWNVPARNANFTGRRHDLEAIALGLAAGSTVTVMSIKGLGGVGKSQLVIEYAYAHATDYDVVWWINAAEPASLPDQFAALDKRLGLDQFADAEGPCRRSCGYR
jgi:hypothetical protein